MKTLLTLLFVFYAQHSFSQESFWLISGRILDDVGKPIEFSNVYANNTTIGTSTDSKGEFILKIPISIPNIEIVVSMVGYQAIKRNILRENKEKFTFHLSSLVLNEIKIKAKKDTKFKEKWLVFQKGLLGESLFTSECQVLNSETISLNYDKKGNVQASAVSPFFVINRALGYKIVVQMKYFLSDGVVTWQITDKYFEDLKPCDEIEAELWKKNRELSFKNSFQSFLISVANNTFIENNFNVFKTNNSRNIYPYNPPMIEAIKSETIFRCGQSDIYYFDEEKQSCVLTSNKPIVVYTQKNDSLYPKNRFDYSIVSFKKSGISFTKNGWITKSDGMVLYGIWGYEGLSTLLPADYGIGN